MRSSKSIVNHYVPDIPDFDRIASLFLALNKRPITLTEARQYQKIWNEYDKAPAPSQELNAALF
jgi:hypothetical protein